MNNRYQEKDSYLYDVFISHASKSSLPFVEQLVEWFEQDNGIKCWFAPRNLDAMAVGKDYDDEIVDAIGNSRCMVVVLNNEALQSKWVKHEVNQADKRDMMVFPFAISELSVNNGLLMRLEDRHIIVAYPDPEKRFPLLLGNVKQILGQDASVEKAEEETDSRVASSSKRIDRDYEEGVALMEMGLDRDAFMSFLRSAKNGNRDAADRLIEIEFDNQRDAQFIDDSTWDEIEELSDNGEGFADLLMHFKYYAMGTQNEVAVKYLERSMEKYDSSYAYLQMGICHCWGLGVKMSDVLALHYYKKALEMGCGIACKYIGQIYRLGGENIEKNMAEAEKYLLMGVDKMSWPCFDQLFWLYISQGEKKKARDIAQLMIDQNIKGGYSLMGDYYSHIERPEEAEKWYKEAVKHGEKSAWGMLSMLHFMKGEKKEAYKMARKGYSENDSSSFRMLGRLYETDGDLDNAWKCFYQSYLTFGICAEELGRLYFDHNYMPEDFRLSALKRILELSARGQDVNSINCLLRLLLKENGQDCTDVSYEALRDIPESYEFLRLGAKNEDAGLLYIFGRLLIESDGSMYNPYKGIDCVLSAAEKADSNAIEYLLGHDWMDMETTEPAKIADMVVKHTCYVGNNTRFVIDNYCGEKGEKFVNWLYESLRLLLYDDTALYYDCFAVFRRIVECCKEDLEEWIAKQVSEFFGFGDDYESTRTHMPQYAFLLAEKLSLEGEREDSELVSQIRDVISPYGGDLTRIHYFKDTVHLLWPDFNPKGILDLDGDFSDETDRNICYGLLNESMPDLPLEMSEPFNDYIEADSHNLPKSFQGMESTRTKAFFSAYRDLAGLFQQLVEEGCAEDVDADEDAFFDTGHFDVPVPIPICCSIGKTLEYSLKAFQMLVASRRAFGRKWREIVERAHSSLPFPVVADSIFSHNAKALFETYRRLVAARDELLLFNVNIGRCTDSQYMADAINSVINELEKENIPHEFTWATKDNLPDEIKEAIYVVGELKAALKEHNKTLY